MQFILFDVNERIVGMMNDAQKCLVDEAQYRAEFTFAENREFRYEDCFYIGFTDIDNNLVLYEIRAVKHSDLSGLVDITAEHAAFAELLDEVVEGKAVNGAMAGFAVTRVIEDTRWTLQSAENTPTMSTTFYYKSVWECLEIIKSSTGCALYFSWVISGNSVSARQIAVKARQGSARGKRFNLSKDLTSITVTEDRSSLYTRLYGRGKGEEVGTNSSGETTYGRRVDFADVIWSTEEGDPMNKPNGQKYIEDTNATERLGRGLTGFKRPRQAVIVFDNCEDAEELLQLTHAKLLTTRYPKLTITARVIDLERVMGYSHEAIRMGDDVLVIADEWNASYQDSVIGIVRDYLNPLNTSVTIGENGTTSYSLVSKLSSDIETIKERADIGSSVASANPGLLNGIIDTMATTIMSTGTNISTDQNDGSLLFTAADGESVVKLTGNGILIANSRIAGAWDWRTAVDGSGIATNALTAGVIKASLVKILGTERFYWDATNIYIIDPVNSDKQIRIGQYDGVNYGIAFTTDGGATWHSCITFSGVTFSASSSTPPDNPAEGDLWIDTSETPYELNVYDGSAWHTVADDSETIGNMYTYVDDSVSRISQSQQEINVFVEQNTVTKNAYDTFTEKIRNILSIEADGTTALFQRISEAISDGDGKQQANYNEILKYIKFVDGDIVLGQTGNEITLTIQNDRLSFTQNGVEIAYMSDSQLFIGNATVKAGGRLTLGAFAFVPRADGSLSFLKVGDA